MSWQMGSDAESYEVELGETKVSAKHGVAIPKAARRLLKVQPGDYVLWLVKDGEVVLRKKRSASSGRAFLAGEGFPALEASLRLSP